MKLFEKKRLISLLLVSFLFSGVLIGVAAESKKSAKTTEKMTPEKKEKIKEITNKLLGLAGPLAKKAINYVVDLTEKYQKELKLSDLLDKLNVPKSPIRSYLDKFSIKTPVIGIEESKGINISGELDIGKIKLTAFLEVGLTGKKIYILFYIHSPDKVRLSTLFPDTFSIAAFLKSLKVPDAEKVAKKFKVQDLFELEDSYFYISTTEIPDHSKLEEVYKGVGFRGNLRFVGILSPLDKIFGLNGRAVFTEGKINYDLAGSSFELKIPTEAVILPESIKVKDKTVPLIPGFNIKLAPFAMKITLSDTMIPAIAGEGGFKIKVPFYRDPLEFYGGIEFATERLKLYGGQKTPVKDLFGIKGLVAQDWEVGLIWDYIIAAELGAATAGLLTLLPVGIIFKGGVEIEKNKVSGLVDMSLHGTRGIDFIWKVEGNIDIRDIIRFWLTKIAKIVKGVNVNQLVKLVPKMLLKDFKLDAAWSEQESKKFLAEVGELNLLGIGGSGKLDASLTGLDLEGSLNPLVIKNPVTKKPMFSFVRSKVKPAEPGAKGGPSFELVLGLLPPDLKIGLDGRVELKLGPGLGEVTSDTKASVSTQGFELRTQNKLLDLSSDIELKAALDDKGELDPKSFYFNGTLESTGLTQLQNLFNKLGKDVFGKAVKALEVAKKKAVEETQKIIDKRISQVDWHLKKVKDEAKNAKKRCDKKNKGIKKILRPACYLKASLPRKGIEIAAQEVYKKLVLKIGKEVMKGKFGKFVVKTGLQAAQEAAKTAQKVANDLSKVAGEMNKFLKKGFNLTYVNLKGSLEDLSGGKFPSARFKGSVLGKNFDIKIPSVNLKKPFDVVKKILKELKIIK